jgi:hypothetical protein
MLFNITWKKINHLNFFDIYNIMFLIFISDYINIQGKNTMWL